MPSIPNAAMSSAISRKLPIYEPELLPGRVENLQNLRYNGINRWPVGRWPMVSIDKFSQSFDHDPHRPLYFMLPTTP